MGLKEEGVRAFGAWEPLSFLIRNGATGVNAPIEDVFAWRHSEEFVKGLKERGFNLYITAFSKGHGIEAEAEDHLDAKRVAALCHKHGIYAGGYVRYSTLIPDTMTKEIPDCLEKFSGKTVRGTYARYNTQYWRYMPCPTSREYLEYFNRLIAIAVKDIGFDLLHVDGMALRHEPDSCRCERCKNTFHDWLSARYPTAEARKKRFGYPHIDHLDLPDYTTGVDFASPLPVINDPLAQEWMFFKADLLAMIWKAIVNSAHEHNPHCLAQCNSSFYPTSNGMWFAGLDVVKLAAAGNYGFFSEEGAPPQLTSDGRLHGYFETFKKLRRLGFVTFAYNRDPETGAPPTDTERIKLHMAVQMAFNLDTTGVFCAVPSAEEFPQIDTGYARFHKEHRDLFLHATHAHDVAIYYSQRTNALNCGIPLATGQLTKDTLMRAHIPFGYLYSEKRSEINNFRAVVLPEVECLGDDEADAIACFVKDGGGLLIIGANTGRYDEFRKMRRKNILIEKLGIALPDTSAFVRRVEKGRVAYLKEMIPSEGSLGALVDASLKQTMPFPYLTSSEWRLPRNRGDLLRLLQWCAGDYRFSFTLPDTTVVEFLEQTNPSRFILHLVNYDLKRDVGSFEIRCNGFAASKAEIFTPEGAAPRARILSSVSNASIISVAGFKRYLIVVIS
ncbi:MAG: beta-galactosidase [Kiritimatiellia bacterium]|nr:beta-galactosidase [Kiritimatiellia bacterium]